MKKTNNENVNLDQFVKILNDSMSLVYDVVLDKRYNITYDETTKQIGYLNPDNQFEPISNDFVLNIMYSLRDNWLSNTYEYKTLNQYSEILFSNEEISDIYCTQEFLDEKNYVKQMCSESKELDEVDFDI